MISKLLDEHYWTDMEKELVPFLKGIGAIRYQPRSASKQVVDILLAYISIKVINPLEESLLKDVAFHFGVFNQGREILTEEEILQYISLNLKDVSSLVIDRLKVRYMACRYVVRINGRKTYLSLASPHPLNPEMNQKMEDLKRYTNFSDVIKGFEVMCLEKIKREYRL